MKIKGLFLTLVLVFSTVGMSQAKTYKIATSPYVGWYPWVYAQDTGILAKNAKASGIEVKLDMINDYVESVNLYTSGTYVGITVTNMDALTIPAVGGVDSTAIIVGDYSNGNDGIVLKNASSMADIKGRSIKLVEFSVSHYLLGRALQMNGLSERNIKTVNTSDADIASVFTTDNNPKASVVTWNPILQNVRGIPSASLVFDSSKIPGEILDLMVVRTDADPALKKTLVSTWYEVMNIMTSKSSDRKKAIESMASASATTPQEFEAQLKTTYMYYTPTEAVNFAKSDKLKQTMEFVRTFSFDHGLFTGAKTKDHVGIQFPDGTVMGNPKNVKLRFDASYMEAVK